MFLPAMYTDEGVLVDWGSWTPAKPGVSFCEPPWRNAVDGVLETTVSMRVWRGMPWLLSRRGEG